MLEAARLGAEGGAPPPSPALPGNALRTSATAVVDGGWIAFPPPSGRHWHAAIYDPVRDRMVVFGGNDGIRRNDVWTLSLAGSPVWSQLTPSGSPPSVRANHTAIYDPVRDRMLVFGGDDPNNDLWALSLAGIPAWSQLVPSGSPPSARYGHSAVYDTVRDRMVVFGGDDGIRRNDVWVLSLAASPAWSELTAAGSPPSARSGHSASYDPVRDHMVVFGGYDGGFRNDVWTLSLAESPTWTSPTPPGTPPSGRFDHTAIYDPVRECMVVFGGFAGSGPNNDVWTLSLAGSPTWSELTAAGSAPSARDQHTAIYDPLRDRMVVFGGESFGSNFSGDMWALSLAGSPAWSELASPVGPSVRYSHSAIYDPVRDRMVVFGGYGAGSFRNDVWALSLVGSPTWSELTPLGTPPSARYGHSAIYDPVRDRMVVFGGIDGSPRNDVRALSLAGSPTWTSLTPSGTPPTARADHTAVYDPVRDRMLVFAGADAIGFSNDVKALSLAGSPAWSDLATAGMPPPGRYQHTAIYDPARDRMVVFGGYNPSFLNDVWVLSLAGSPGWSALAPSGSPPPARRGHSAIYDPVRDRMVAFGGGVGGNAYPSNESWALSLAGSTAWSALAPSGGPPPTRVEPTALYDPLRDRMVMFGGYDGLRFNNDCWVLVWGTPVSVDYETPGWLRLDAPRPNPSRGETTVDFELAAPARVVLELFDAQGRRVKRLADEWFTAGRHVSMWRGDDDRGHALGSGVYFIRMQVGIFQTTRRAVRVR